MELIFKEDEQLGWKVDIATNEYVTSKLAKALVKC